MLGLVGTNGIGKSTALKILAAKLKPNLGRYKVTSNLGYESLSLLVLFQESKKVVKNFEGS